MMQDIHVSVNAFDLIESAMQQPKNMNKDPEKSTELAVTNVKTSEVIKTANKRVQSRCR